MQQKFMLSTANFSNSIMHFWLFQSASPFLPEQKLQSRDGNFNEWLAVCLWAVSVRLAHQGGVRSLWCHPERLALVPGSALRTQSFLSLIPNPPYLAWIQITALLLQCSHLCLHVKKKVINLIQLPPSSLFLRPKYGEWHNKLGSFLDMVQTQEAFKDFSWSIIPLSASVAPLSHDCPQENLEEAKLKTATNINHLEVS